MKGKAGTIKGKNKDEAGTPLWLYEGLNFVFKFKLDVCASKKNHKHWNYFTKKEDSLKQKWTSSNFMNPPYSDMSPWIEKASSEEGKTCALLKCDPSTKNFINCYHFGHVILLNPRIKHEGFENSADFPSMLVIFNGKHIRRIERLTVTQATCSLWTFHLKQMLQ